MPRFEPFRGLRYTTTSNPDVTSKTSPPYDVFDESRRADLASQDAHNIVRVDYPIESEGEARYDKAGLQLRQWRDSGVLTLEESDSFYIYRMSFTDEAGRPRTTVGVVGALEVVNEGTGGVLPHEKTTPKAKTDRLDLTRATRCNLSPVWGLSLAEGLSDLLTVPGTVVATCLDEDGVSHSVERIDDASRVSQIGSCVGRASVLIADGHHRYAISRTFRDEERGLGRRGGAELTMTYVQELIEEQLSVAAIHRLYDVPSHVLLPDLARHYDMSPAGHVGQDTISSMAERGSLCLVDPDGSGTFLTPIEASFEGVRALDSARLEFALRDVDHQVSYQHGVGHVLKKLSTGDAKSGILIRPVSLDEIRRTARTGELMPPKSTFFTPKLRTGMVLRPLD